jgi:hypothetical protein
MVRMVNQVKNKIMSMYIKNSVIEANQIEAITFDELVEYGKNCEKVNMVNGMPWNFMWHGLSVTHENDDHYIVNTIDLHRGQVLLCTEEDEIIVRDWDNFFKKYRKL